MSLSDALSCTVHGQACARRKRRMERRRLATAQQCNSKKVWANRVRKRKKRMRRRIPKWAKRRTRSIPSSQLQLRCEHVYLFFTSWVVVVVVVVVGSNPFRASWNRDEL